MFSWIIYFLYYIFCIIYHLIETIALTLDCILHDRWFFATFFQLCMQTPSSFIVALGIYHYYIIIIYYYIIIINILIRGISVRVILRISNMIVDTIIKIIEVMIIIYYLIGVTITLIIIIILTIIIIATIIIIIVIIIVTHYHHH